MIPQGAYLLSAREVEQRDGSSGHLPMHVYLVPSRRCHVEMRASHTMPFVTFSISFLEDLEVRRLAIMKLSKVAH